jgi:hypothetical protein
MPRPQVVTKWPVGDDLRAWLGEDAVSAVTDANLIDECVADAAAGILERLDPAKLPAEEEDEDICPRSVHRAIVLEAARLLYRRQSPHGVAAFAEVAIRLRADPDVESRLEAFEFGPEP